MKCLANVAKATAGMMFLLTSWAVAAEPSLRIVAPSATIEVRAGDSFEVVVDSAEQFLNVALLTRGPFNGYVHSPTLHPWRFPVGVDRDAEPGDYAISAAASLGSNLVVSQPVHVVVLPPADLVTINATPEAVALPYVGSGEVLQIKGVNPAQEKMKLPVSRIKFVSSNPQIVSVDMFGELLARASGDAVVTATYNNMRTTVNVKVLQPKPGDFNGDNVVDERDLFQLQRSIGIPNVIPGDAYDLNQDGRIDKLDLNKLHKLCTRPKCAPEEFRYKLNTL